MKTNIYLISTVHSEKGNCTSKSLFEILHKIKPDVIFCEASTKMYEEFKIGLNQSSLELNAIKKLCEFHSFYFLPVDTDPPLSSNIRNQFEEIKTSLKKDEIFTTIWSKKEEHTKLFGFKYLNSDDNNKLFDKILKRINYVIPRLSNSEYKITYKKWLHFHDSRENTMLENINSFVENNELENAVFLCGSAHRKSITNKIKEKKNTRLNWNFEFPK
ncbi:hypothetical protein [Arenibacter sp. ARW7G5Y1]|uniref:hypothetical protein n=1 Tax=Arenibacter sp. ARW7G5Y1 TaxID=2135619 RepID=UPI000D7735B7|nr:hypothetical protein [Arenibacter sp. ARW7G5Y1]PXX23722.1 hypothetical protein C7972_11815 [Arenibacter sp. ARW7G5Y1]